MSSTAAKKQPASGVSLLEELGYMEEDAAAKAVEVMPLTLVAYRKQGVGPQFTLVGRRVLYSKKALTEWLEKGGVKGAASVLS